MGTRNIEEIILVKLADEPLTEEETEHFKLWYSADDGNRLYYESLMRVRSGIIAAGAAGVDHSKAWGRVRPPAHRVSIGKRIARYTAVLALTVTIGLGYTLYRGRQVTSEDNIVKPGEGRAVLVSPTGERRILTISEEGSFNNLAHDVPSEMEAIMRHDTALDDAGMEVFSAIETPRGGYWNVVLDDGTQVWINSESILRFPVAFGPGKRTVKLEGEAYFRVAPDAVRPFTVRTGDYDIRVTGTEFNVKSYTAGATSTTLVEGGVEIEMNGMVSTMKPNQQAILSNGQIAIRDVDTERFVAWQHGVFSYSQTRLADIMDELSRWYDIDVVWKNDGAENFHFSAWFSRQSEFDEIIEVLGKTNTLEFTLKGRTLTINKK